MAVRSPVLCKERTLLIFPVTYSDWSNPWHDLHWWIPALESWMLKDSKKWHCKVDQAIWCYLMLFAHVSHAYMSEFLSSKNEMILESNWGSQKASSAGSKGCGHSLLTAATTHWTVPLRDRKSFPWEWRVVPRGLGLPISGLRLGNHGQTIGRWLRQSRKYCGRSGRLFQDDKRTWKGRGKAQSMVIPCILSRTCHRGKNTIGPEVDQAKGVFTRSEPEHWSFLQHMWPKATWERFIGQPWVLKLWRSWNRGSLGFGRHFHDLSCFFLLHLIRAISPVAGGYPPYSCVEAKGSPWGAESFSALKYLRVPPFHSYLCCLGNIRKLWKAMASCCAKLPDQVWLHHAAPISPNCVQDPQRTQKKAHKLQA